MAGKKPAFNFTFDENETKFQENAAKGFGPIPRGRYNVVITDVKVEITESGRYAGKQQLNLTVKGLSGEAAGREIRYVRVPLFSRFDPTPNRPEGTATSMHGFFRAVGMYNEAKSAVEVSDWNNLFHKEANVLIDVQEPDDQGRVFNQIRPFAGVWEPKAENVEGEDDGEITFEDEDEQPF